MDSQERTFFISLHQMYYDRLVSWCQSYVPYDSELKHYVEDWVQEAFFRAMNNKKKFMAHPNKYGWLVLACKHVADNDIQRKITRCKHNQFSLDEPAAPSVIDVKARVDKWIDTEASQEMIASVLSRLTPHERDICNDVLVNKVKEATVAIKFQKSLSAIKDTVHRIRKKARLYREEEKKNC
jgi:DNA-directed RNA polymerase specialized sigma subunit, sigma24 homolog